VTPIFSSPPALAALSGRAFGLDPSRRPDHDTARGAAIYPTFTLETPAGDRIRATGSVARFEHPGGNVFDAARIWLASLAAGARVEGGSVDECLVSLVVFPFESDAPAGAIGDLHRAWIPARIETRDASGRGRTIEWGARGETPPAAFPPPEAAGSTTWAGEGWTHDGWTRAVESALERIRSGSVRKVVLARSRIVEGAAPFEADRVFDALRESYPACYRYRYESGDGSVFLGASPERLVTLRSGTVEADAVAGTGATEDAALLEDRKERLEHDIVVQEILAALGPVAERIEADPLPSIHRLRNVTHLRTRIRAEVRPGTHILDLAARIHPSPAVAGAPRDAALQLIRSLEPVPRGWYAGPIGWTSAGGEGELTLGLRAALTRGTRALLHAGAGIVLGSDPDREWEECESKMRAMEEALRG
jgi:isochorismate synthase